MKRLMLAAALAAVWIAAGCGSNGGLGRSPDDFVKPTIAVMKFDSRAAFPLGWNLGGGMQETLVDRLMATGRYHVVERQELASVMGEQQFQQSGATRPQGRAATGRIKNCQYLIKGVVTDFGHVSTNQGGVASNLGSLFGGSHLAVMGIILYVVEVESGEVIASESLSESVRAGDVSVQVAYQNVAFGGTAFYKTPLGRATARVIDRAVKRITEAIASRPWQPQVALVQQDGSVVLNGGRDRGVKTGAEFEVLDAGPPILDPSTGDVLGHSAGRTVGRIIVQDVHERYSTATIVTGLAAEFRAGQTCRRSG
jgi:curli biogenesis system outer membrane secretion channel CsgG